MAVAKEKEKEQRGKAARPSRTDSGSGGRAATDRENRENAIVRTFRETRSELRKVVWPTREETIRLTLVVIAISSVIGLILFAGDSLFLSLYGFIVNLVSA